jgi:hypothetical protein
MPGLDTDMPTVATFGTTSSRQYVGCRVCGRTLLLGERSIGFFTPSGEGPYDVCELCVPRAHRFGLRPRPSTPDEVARARRGNVLRRLTALLGRGSGDRRAARPSRAAATPPAAQGSAAVAAASASQSGRRGRRRRASAAPLDRAALGAVPVGAAAIPVALAAFNQSGNARTLAGLHRTLGAPRASVTPRSATDREVILTVAWEIVWYQFRIMPDGIEQERGQYLSELQSRWQQWNCAVSPDGTVQFAGSAAPAAGTDDLNAPHPEAPHR